MSKSFTQIEHGVVCHLPNEPFGYFGWPSIARLDDGTLIAVSSGLRQWHVCPFGKTIINFSHDNGATWTPPRVIRDSPIDDRDAGLLCLGGSRLLLTMFSSDPRPFINEPLVAAALREQWPTHLATLTDAIVQPHLGSWAFLSEDAGATWGNPIPAPVFTPHGPILLRSGRVLYLGKDARDLADAGVLCAISDDGAHTWQTLGEVPLAEGTVAANYHEPHVIELPSGRLIGLIRLETVPQHDVTQAGYVSFSLMQTESDDGGRTWSRARPATGLHGSPPHLMRHSSGALLCVYGYRLPPFGQRAMLSYDDGQTWDSDYIIRDDGPTWDLGYTSAVELADGSIFALYYQEVNAGEPCALLWSRFRI